MAKTRENATFIPMGKDPDFTTRIDRHLRQELEAAYNRRFNKKGDRAKLIAPSLSQFLQYLLARGLDLENEKPDQTEKSE